MAREQASSSDSRAAAGAESLLAGARGWLHDGVELLRVRVALAATEAAEHSLDLLRAAGWAVAAAVWLALGLGFAAVLLTVLLWDSHRIVAMSVFSALFLVLGGVALLAVRRSLRSIRWFEASLTELARDAQRLRGRF